MYTYDDGRYKLFNTSREFKPLVENLLKKLSTDPIISKAIEKYDIEKLASYYNWSHMDEIIDMIEREVDEYNSQTQQQ